jgi:hypothetical protein
MYHTILGHGGFYNGLQRFFKQHDGTVSTCTVPEQLSSTSTLLLHSAVARGQRCICAVSTSLPVAEAKQLFLSSNTLASATDAQLCS